MGSWVNNGPAEYIIIANSRLPVADFWVLSCAMFSVFRVIRGSSLLAEEKHDPRITRNITNSNDYAFCPAA